MQFYSTLDKMPSWLNPAQEAQYLFKADQDFVKLNPLIGRQITIEFQNQKYCSNCGQQVPDLFRMGFCRSCFFTAPQAGESIIRPELSQAHKGLADRDLAYEKAYQLQPHVVYLANSGALKVGVTRARQKRQRWIDQGASAAVVLAETENRYEAGLIEVALKAHLGDKTPWQRMLKNELPDLDLLAEKARVASLLPEDLQAFVSQDEQVYETHYPVRHYPQKIKNLKLDKESEISGILEGVKGQYLLLSEDRVFNIRASAGYRVKFAFA